MAKPRNSEILIAIHQHHNLCGWGVNFMGQSPSKYNHTIFIQLHFNIILPLTHRCSECELPFRLPNENSTWTSPFPLHTTYHATSSASIVSILYKSMYKKPLICPLEFIIRYFLCSSLVNGGIEERVCAPFQRNIYDKFKGKQTYRIAQKNLVHRTKSSTNTLNVVLQIPFLLHIKLIPDNIYIIQTIIPNQVSLSFPLNLHLNSEICIGCDRFSHICYPSPHH